jgi:hypothetical protein
MALFVFGAGATRGCSFVRRDEFPCLPPLDKDFFTQLQAVSNPKHKDLVQSVIKDVIDLFGPNFDVTMETVFTTLEHTIRMLKTTGENRDFKTVDLQAKRDRLKQAIAVVLEESLTKNRAGVSSIEPQKCKYHKKFIQDILQTNDCVITFNYDCVLDFSLKQWGSNKWNAHYGYGFNLGPGGKCIKGYTFWQPNDPATKDNTINLFKLHGALNFIITDSKNPPHVQLKQRPYTKQGGSGLKFSIIPPEWHKEFDKGAFGTLWSRASIALNRAEHIILLGYSLPPTDLHSTALFRTSVKKGALKSLVIVNPDQDARRRSRSVFQRAMTEKTKVLSFDYFPEFLAADRSLWQI